MVPSIHECVVKALLRSVSAKWTQLAMNEQTTKLLMQNSHWSCWPLSITLKLPCQFQAWWVTGRPVVHRCSSMFILSCQYRCGSAPQGRDDLRPKWSKNHQTNPTNPRQRRNSLCNICSISAVYLPYFPWRWPTYFPTIFWQLEVIACWSFLGRLPSGTGAADIFSVSPFGVVSKNQQKWDECIR